MIILSESLEASSRMLAPDFALGAVGVAEAAEDLEVAFFLVTAVVAEALETPRVEVRFLVLLRVLGLDEMISSRDLSRLVVADIFDVCLEMD